jgi:hypothetical protein
MPFSIIHYAQVNTVTDADGKTESYITPELALHWYASETEIVQFTVKIDREVIVETARLINEGNYGNDRVIEFASAPLGRPELNEGIRAFRRARNARYGADE